MVVAGIPARIVVVGRSLERVQLGARISIAAGGRLAIVSKMRADWIIEGIWIWIGKLWFEVAEQLKYYKSTVVRCMEDYKIYLERDQLAVKICSSHISTTGFCFQISMTS